MAYRLYYWPGIPGRGEFVRLALEEAGAAYRDVARTPRDEGGGADAIARLLADPERIRPAFAPPILEDDGRLIGETAAILLFLGERHGLAPGDPAERLWVHQIQLTLADLVMEVHDTHHPISSAAFYDDQREAARARAAAFRTLRMPKYAAWLDRVLAGNDRSEVWLVGEEPSYADLSLFQIVAGLRHAFPDAMAALETGYPRLTRLHDAVAERPRIAAYLAGDRRQPFNQDGIFRFYPELQG